MLIVDGHQSRIHPDFGKYVNNEAYLWRILFGVPYATVLWHVGNASEQNGKFKVKWYNIKLKWMQWKDKLNLHISLSATNITPLTNKIFHLSYGNLVENLEATGDRGWFPFNRMLIDHPDLVDESKAMDANTHAANSDVAATSISNTGDDVVANSNINTRNSITLNIGEGASAAVLDRLIAKQAKYVGGKKAADERKQKGDSVTQNLQEAKKLSAGIIVSNSIHSPNDKRFLKAYNKRSTDTIEKAKKTATKKRMT